MNDLSHIPDAELEIDRIAAIEDIALCIKAYSQGFTHHKDGFPTLDRIRGNCDQLDVIVAEKKRRAGGKDG